MTAWVWHGVVGFCWYSRILSIHNEAGGSCGQGYHQARILTPAHTIVIVSEERQVREGNIAGDSGDHIKHLPL